MFEVYSGHTPGRRNLAAILSGAVLVAVLGVAWLQGRSHRILGDPVAITGTNLTIRLPKGWVEDSDSPGTFLFPNETDSNGGGRSIGRWMRISAGRERVFESPYPTQSLQRGFAEERRLRRGSVTRIKPIAGLHAVEQIWDTTRRFLVRGRRREFALTIIVRQAASLRGDFIHLEYETLSALSAGDRLLLDAICSGIRRQPAEPQVDPAHATSRIGVEFELEPDWTVAHPAPPQLAGLYLGPPLDSDEFWSVAVFRTRFATQNLQRTLVRFAGRRGIRLAASDFLQFTEPVQTDGNQVVGVYYRGNNRNRQIPIGSLWIVSASETETVLIVSLARGSNVEAAERAAKRIAETIRFAPDKAVTPVSEDELKQRFAR
ncbi:MAG: hypothetical protein IID33_00430 [Planctomycetes bacterium]|nr:hypothetical protein [Planctomycetota bacterium]